MHIHNKHDVTGTQRNTRGAEIHCFYFQDFVFSLVSEYYQLAATNN